MTSNLHLGLESIATLTQIECQYAVVVVDIGVCVYNA